MHDATLFIGMISPNKSLSHFLQMYSLDVGIGNLLDSASTTTVLSKLYFDSLKMIHCDFGISVLWQHVQTVIFQCNTLGCIICWKITCYIVFIMSSTFLYIVVAILVMIYITPKHIRIWTILDILAVFAIF